MAVEVVDTAWDVTTISDCSLFMEVLVLNILASSSPLYSWVCSADNFFSCSILTPSLALIQTQFVESVSIAHLVSKPHGWGF